MKNDQHTEDDERCMVVSWLDFSNSMYTRNERPVYISHILEMLPNVISQIKLLKLNFPDFFALKTVELLL